MKLSLYLAAKSTSTLTFKMGLLAQIQCNLVFCGILFVVSERFFAFRWHRQLIRPCKGCHEYWNEVASGFEKAPDPEVAVAVCVCCMFLVFNLVISAEGNSGWGSSGEADESDCNYPVFPERINSGSSPSGLPPRVRKRPTFSSSGGSGGITGSNGADNIGSVRSGLLTGIKKLDGFETWLSTLSFEGVQDLAVKHTIFFEIQLQRQRPEDPWGFEVEKGDGREWTVSKVHPGTAAARAFSPAFYFAKRVDSELLEPAFSASDSEGQDSKDASLTSPDFSGSPELKKAAEENVALVLHAGDLILGINTVVAPSSFPQEMKRSQQDPFLKLAIVRTVYWGDPCAGLEHRDRMACFEAIREHYKKRLAKEGGGNARGGVVVSLLPEEHEVKTTTAFNVTEKDVVALQAFKIEIETPPGGDKITRYRLGVEVMKASAHADGRESLYIKRAVEGLLYHFCHIREGDYIDAINGETVNLAQKLQEFSVSLRNGTTFDLRRVDTPGIRLTFGSVLQVELIQ